jgi:hypothetical protein
MSFTVGFKFEIGERVFTQDTAGKQIETAVQSLCFNGESNLYYLKAPKFKDAWVKESFIKKAD